jgi:hypothetical protein
MGLVHHTDAAREWAYDRNSPVGRLDKAWDEAVRRGWTVVDMKRDWKKVFPFDRDGAGAPFPAARLCFPLALLHEAFLGGAGERPAVAAHRLDLTGVALALLEETGLGRARERLALLLTALLSQVSCAKATAERFSDRTRAASRIRSILCLHREVGELIWEVERSDSHVMAQRTAPTCAIDPESRSTA